MLHLCIEQEHTVSPWGSSGTKHGPHLVGDGQESQ